MTPPFTTDDAERTSARSAFLNTVRKLQPKVLADLEGLADLFPLTWRQTRKLETVEREYGGELWAELSCWADSYNLNAPWVLLAAAETIAAWTEFPSVRGHWAPRVGSLPTRRGELFYFMDEAPDLSRLTRSEAERTITETFRVYLESYLDRLAVDYKEQGWEVGKQRRAADKHLEWLVRFQVLCESMSRIAQAVPPIASRTTPRETVGKAVREVAELIDLPLRVSRGGRPRKPAT